jgi:hypothetical protein
MDDRVAHQRGFRGRRFGQHECTAVATRGQHHRERAANGAQLAGQRQLAREFMAREGRSGNLSAGGEDAERDGQVEASGFLRQVGRRQVHRHLPRGKLELRVLQRSTHAVARFAHLRLGQADQVHARQPVGQMHLDRHHRRIHPRKRAAVHHRNRHGSRSRSAPADSRSVGGREASRPRPFGRASG